MKNDTLTEDEYAELCYKLLVIEAIRRYQATPWERAWWWIKSICDYILLCVWKNTSRD